MCNLPFHPVEIVAAAQPVISPLQVWIRFWQQQLLSRQGRVSALIPPTHVKGQVIMPVMLALFVLGIFTLLLLPILAQLPGNR